LNVIDALSQGFSTIHRRWWVLLIPILLDLFLWLGPQMAIEPIVAEMSTILTGSDLLRQAEQTDPTLKEAILATLDSLSKNYNLFSALRARMLGVPSLLVWGGAGYQVPTIYEVIWIYFLQMINIPDLAISVSPATFFSRPVWQLADPFAWLGLNVLVSLIGVAIGSFYLTLIAQPVSTAEQPLPFGARVIRLGGHVLLFGVLRTVAWFVLGVPFFFFLGILGMLSTGLAMFVALGLMGALVWLSFYGIFFVASLAVNQVTIWQALWNSLNVVLRNFWSTLWLFVLINLIGGGLTILWQQLSTGSWLTMLGILGNAYVGSSLLAGSLIFYRDRYDRWRERVAQLVAETRRQS